MPAAYPLGDEDITALAPEQRVRRGLVRTFQINSLFPHLTALESVTLAVCERRRAARKRGGGSFTAYSHEIDEAYDILTALKLAPVCQRPTRELAYGQQRLLEIALALATRPKVLLLDEPAAGVPRDESKELFAAIAGLSRDITVLFIEHDMELVFRFASRVIVMVGGRVLLEGTPHEIAADPRVRAVYLGQGASWLRRMTEQLMPDDVRGRVTAPPSCSTACRSNCRNAAVSPCSAATASASRRCS